MNRQIALFLSLFCTLAIAYAQDEIILTEIASGFSVPVAIAQTGDDRLFVVEKRGVIKIMDTTGQVLPDPFLDIDARVNSGSSERGLLGMAFHPDYDSNGFFFVNYSGLDGSTVIERFQRDSMNTNLADPNSGKVLLEIGQPFSNHNGGNLAFGPDGYLYIGTGDGGSGGDPGNRSQNPLLLLGKMLRIDVDSGDPYGIPEDNPFAETDAALDEIWALGLRNPWRYSFDRETGDLYIADVGQNAWEEVNFQAADLAGGRNYGWRCYEANAAFNNNGCPEIDSFTAPVFAYAHEGFNCAGSITGGFVYRGARHPDLYGMYIMTDYCKGKFRGFRVDSAGVVTDERELADLDPFEYTTFGEDADGELYVAAGSGSIYKLEQTPTSSTRQTLTGEWEVYPVPADDVVRFIRTTEVAPVKTEVRLYNSLGSMVLRSNIHADGQLSVVQLAPGIYYAHISDGTHTHLVKLIIQ